MGILHVDLDVLLLNICLRKLKLSSVALVREQTIQTERLPPVTEVDKKML